MRKANPKPGKWMALGVLVVSGAACADAVSMQEMLLARYAAAGGDANNDFDNVEIVDKDLSSQLTVLRAGSDIDEDKTLTRNKPMSIFAGFRNRTSRRLVVEVETIYKDKDGNALNDGSWIVMTLKPHEEKEYRSASISMQAVDFLVRVRHATGSSSTAHD